jgi:hypothetical protein
VPPTFGEFFLPLEMSSQTHSSRLFSIQSS